MKYLDLDHQNRWHKFKQLEITFSMFPQTLVLLRLSQHYLHCPRTSDHGEASQCNGALQNICNTLSQHNRLALAQEYFRIMPFFIICYELFHSWVPSFLIPSFILSPWECLGYTAVTNIHMPAYGAVRTFRQEELL